MESKATPTQRIRPAKMVELGEDGRPAFTVEGFAWATGLGRSSIFEAIGRYRRGEPDGLPVVERQGRTLILREDGLRWLRAGCPDAGTIVDPIERKLDAIEHRFDELGTLLESELATRFRELRDRLDNLLAQFDRVAGKI